MNPEIDRNEKNESIMNPEIDRNEKNKSIMNPVTVRNVKIGEGMPKICVPVVGGTKADIISEAGKLLGIPADLAEWRVDWYEDVSDLEKVKDVQSSLRSILKDMPLLLTLRTAREGGKMPIAPGDYAAWIKAALTAGSVDLADIEAFTGDDLVREVIETAHGLGVKVIASNHDFDKTPDKDDLIGRMCKMQELGADICKIAVMPQCPADVLTLLAATEEMCRLYADRPVITMSMAAQGAVSRLCGEVFGSAVTFGAAGRASAPGQIAVEDLSHVLRLLH